MEAGGMPPAGSARALRIDPFALPVRYPAQDLGADGNVRQVELNRERVVVRRAVRGMRMKLRLPVAAFQGVALRLLPSLADEPAAVTVMLEHNDQALSVPLYASPDTDDVLAVWKAWGRVLRLPLLVESDGGLCEPFEDQQVGGVAIGKPRLRRRRRSALKRRRPSILMRRKAGRSLDDAKVHRDEHEIIARD
jgi:uncharacterized protein DUF6101